MRFNSSKNQLSLIAYQLNLVSRQFGIIQSLPSPIYSWEKLLLFYNADYSGDAATKYIGRYVGQTVLTLFDFNLNFLRSPLFEDWWKQYYNNEFFDEKEFAAHLQEAFALVSDKIKRVILFLKENVFIVFDLIIRRLIYTCSFSSGQEDRHQESRWKRKGRIPFCETFTKDKHFLLYLSSRHITFDANAFESFLSGYLKSIHKKGKFKKLKSLVMKKKSLLLSHKEAQVKETIPYSWASSKNQGQG